LTVELGDVAHVLANDDGAVEVVEFFDEKVETIAFVILKKTDGDARQHVGLAGKCRARHVQGWSTGGGKSSSS